MFLFFCLFFPFFLLLLRFFFFFSRAWGCFGGCQIRHDEIPFFYFFFALRKKKCIFRVLFMCLSLFCFGQRLFVGEEKKTSVALTSRSRFVRIIAKIASQKSHYSLYVLTSWWTTKTTLRAKRDNRNTKRRTLTHRACASA